MARYGLKKDGYEISKARYGELCYFCEQYPEWVDWLKNNTDTAQGVGYSDEPKGNSKQDKDGDLAVERAKRSEKVEMIEQAAQAADGDLYQYIIKNVAYGCGFTVLQGLFEIPCSESTFYRARRRFFWILDKKR